MAYTNVIPNSPSPISMLPESDSIVKESDLLLLTQSRQSSGNKSKKSTIENFMKQLGFAQDSGFSAVRTIKQDGSVDIDDPWYSTYNMDGKICSLKCKYDSATYISVIGQLWFGATYESESLEADVTRDVNDTKFRFTYGDGSDGGFFYIPSHCIGINAGVGGACVVGFYLYGCAIRTKGSLNTSDGFVTEDLKLKYEHENSSNKLVPSYNFGYQHFVKISASRLILPSADTGSILIHG